MTSYAKKLISYNTQRIDLILTQIQNMSIIYNIFLNQEKTPSSRLVTHLALADLLVCLTLYPTQIVQSFHEEVKDDHQFWTITRTAIYISIMMLLSITTDKYLYIAKPLKYPLIMTTRRTSKLLTCIWLAALVIQLPLICISRDHNKTCIKYHCLRLVLWLQIIQQLAAICVMTTLNYKMFKIVKEQRQRMASLRIFVTASTVRVGTNHDLVTSSCKGSESYEDIRHYRWSLDMLFCSIYCLGSSIWYFK